MFGEFLVLKKLITQESLNEALIIQNFRKEKLGRILLGLGNLSEENLNSGLKEYLNPICKIKISDLLKMKENISLTSQEKKFLKSIASEVIKKDNLYVTLVGLQLDDSVIRKAEIIFQKEILFKTVDNETLLLLGVESAKNYSPHTKVHITKTLSDEERLEANNPYSKLICESINFALINEASDIHYEPDDSGYIIRFRIHGILEEWKIINKKHTEGLTTRLKNIVNMDLSVIGKPQDSRATFPKRKLDIRASSLPILNQKEKIVLRLQRQDQKVALEDLGLSDQAYNTLTSSIIKSGGLILISGPTGSGKTTTLYALLDKMDKMGKNISTLENPIEKKIGRITQANIKDYKNFEYFERALMRQDPDIILIGEIRDRQSAELCMKLSSTGHLVLSTIHANGALEVIQRLKSLGIDDFSIQSNLRLSVAQRLVRKICPNCSSNSNYQLLERVFKLTKSSYFEHGSFKTLNPKGCKHCKDGIVGRCAVLEYLSEDEIKSYLKDSSLAASQSLQQEYLELAAKGQIDTFDILST